MSVTSGSLSFLEELEIALSVHLYPGSRLHAQNGREKIHNLQLKEA